MLSSSWFVFFVFAKNKKNKQVFWWSCWEKEKGKQALAIEAYARALRQLPTIIVDNGGYDSAELVQNLKVALINGDVSSGLNMNNGTVDDMQKLGITVRIIYLIHS